MKKISRILKIAGLLVMAIGFITPWYVWGIEFVENKVVFSIWNSSLSEQAFGDPFQEGVNKLEIWKLINPRSLVSDKPLLRGHYFEYKDITANKALEEIGTKWAVIPTLTLLLFAIVFAASVVRMQKTMFVRESLLPLLVGICITLLLLLWNPVTPESLLKPTPSLGKYLTVLGALLLAISGFINLFSRSSLKHQ